MPIKEYYVEEQLRKMAAHISIMDLWISSDSHRDALVKVLRGLSVPSNTTSEALAATIGKMLEANKSSNQREELLVEGMDHNKALYIIVKYRDKVMSRVLAAHHSSCRRRIQGKYLPILYFARIRYSFEVSERKPCKNEGFRWVIEGCRERST